MSSQPSDLIHINELIASVGRSDQDEEKVRIDNGWRTQIPGGYGFRHEYEPVTARGAWEFRLLHPGLSVAIVNYAIREEARRSHMMENNLVLSSVLSGHSSINDTVGTEGALTKGYCTVYGHIAGQALETLYSPKQPLKWVSIFIDRSIFRQVMSIQDKEMPTPILDFVDSNIPIAPRNIPLSTAALSATNDILNCDFEGGYAQTYLYAKAIELACSILHVQKITEEESFSESAFSAQEIRKLKIARKLLEERLHEPFNIMELSKYVGLNRQRLQTGFRLLYNHTAGRLRDKIRMERANELIQFTDLPVIQIALEVGYDHHSSFSRAFRNEFGVSPTDLRLAAQREQTNEEAASTTLK